MKLIVSAIKTYHCIVSSESSEWFDRFSLINVYRHFEIIYIYLVQAYNSN